MTILLPSRVADIRQNLAATLRAAAQLQVRILVVGERRALAECRNTAAQLDVPNVEFRSAAAPDLLSVLAAEGSIHVIFQEHRRENRLVPKRTSETLAAGRPSLFVGPADCETAVILEDSRSGFVVAPDDEDGLEEGIRILVRSPALREDMGRNARDYYEYYFCDDDGMSRMGEILRKFCGGRDGYGHRDADRDSFAGTPQLQMSRRTPSHS